MKEKPKQRIVTIEVGAYEARWALHDALVANGLTEQQADAWSGRLWQDVWKVLRDSPGFRLRINGKIQKPRADPDDPITTYERQMEYLRLTPDRTYLETYRAEAAKGAKGDHVAAFKVEGRRTFDAAREAVREGRAADVNEALRAEKDRAFARIARARGAQPSLFDGADR